MSTFRLKTKVIRVRPLAQLPQYATEGALCFDLQACLDDEATMAIPPGETARVPTGLAFELLPGWGLDVFARSSLALRGLSLANGVGKIDPDYRGELMVLLHNHSPRSVFIVHGMRIAQASPVQMIRAEFQLVEALSETERGAGGFGSTGV